MVDRATCQQYTILNPLFDFSVFTLTNTDFTNNYYKHLTNIYSPLL